MKTLLIVLLLAVSTTAFAQFPDSLNTTAQPKGGKGALQIVYYRIDFTQEETEYLRTHAAELIFSVSDKGVAKLEKVNDIGMRSIVDSMKRVNDRLPEFYPERVNGRAETGVYFLKLGWPNYANQFAVRSPYQQLQYQQLQYNNPYMRKLSDFQEITYRGPRYDMIFGAFKTNFTGMGINRGWGMKFDFMIYGKSGFGGGFGTSIILAKPTTVDRSQPIGLGSRTHIITLFSGMVGKVFKETKTGQFALQFEPAFGITDMVSTDQNGSPSGPVIGLGFSPGGSVTYMLALGKGRMGRQYFLPVAYKQYLSFHVAARALMFNTAAARGNIFEFGVAYRLSTRPVANYKLKE